MLEQLIELFWSTLDSPTSGAFVFISYLAEEFFENQFSRSLTHGEINIAEGFAPRVSQVDKV